MSRSNSPEASVVTKHQYLPSQGNTKVQVWEGRGNLYKIVVENNDSAIVYVQLFDAAAIGDVTLGVTMPVSEYRVQSSGDMGDDSAPEPLTFFSKGCVIAVTDVRGGSGAPGANSSIQLWYQNRKSFG